MKQTPWGPSQQTTIIAEGITEHECAGHGGIHLSPERYAQMPPSCRQTFAGGPWYEEDSDWCLVACAFEEDWRNWADSTDWTTGDKQMSAAWKCLRKFHPAERVAELEAARRATP